MLVSVRWLNRFLQPGFSPDVLAEMLLQAGFEIERVRDLGMVSGKLRTARALRVQPHPQADRLHLVEVDIGAGAPLRIVCGADNVRPGMLVPCALPGFTLPDGTEIGETVIRGQASQAMLCSARELDLGTDHAGILQLPDGYAVGEPVDAVLDVKITPNRGDCLSIFGLARDLAGVLGKRVYPPTPRFTETLERTDQFVDLEVQARRACPRYTCRYLRGVRIGPSPLWLARMLESAGFRSINNVVDVTNFVMLELGVPLHAFDYQRVGAAKIIVRPARPDEPFLTLEGTSLSLSPEDLVIADADRPIALAGVMGGRQSQVTSATEAIVLECACFDPVSVRRTVRRHGLKTESAYRFERGIDREKLHLSLNRAAQLIHEIAGGEVAKGFLDVHHPPGEADKPITLRVARVNGLLGLDLAVRDIADLLVHLGFEIRHGDREMLLVAKPSFRSDIESDVDLIEEVARVHGYGRIPETLPPIAARSLTDVHVPSPTDTPSPAHPAEASHEPPPFSLREFLRALQDRLAGWGLDEAVHASLIAEADARRHGFDPARLPRVANPLSAETTVLRPSLMPGLLAALAFNQRQGAERVALFEVGKTFPPGARVGEEDDEGLTLGIIVAGAVPANWASPARDYDFFDLKGWIETLGHSLGLGAPEISPPAPTAGLHPGRSGTVSWDATAVGWIGELHPEVGEACDLRGRAVAAEMDARALWDLTRRLNPQMRPLPRFPAVQRDLAVVVEASVSAERLLRAARDGAGPRLEDLRLVDVYRGEHVPPGKKSVALRFVFRDPERTLTDEEVNEAMDRIQRRIEDECGGVLRT